MKLEKIAATLAENLKIPAADLSLTPLAGDASSRRFFRLTFPPDSTLESIILVIFAPGESENINLYAQMSRCLRQARIPSPEIIRVDTAGGYLLLGDCGDELLQDAVRSSNRKQVSGLYRKVIDQLILMQERLRPENIPDCPAWRKAFDRETFLRELDFFLQHTLEGYYQRWIAAADRKAFRHFFRIICQNVLAQPRLFCHRDYHSRNLLLQGEQVRVVDFQDARLGPYTYDLASLLQDPYVELTTVVRDSLRDYYASRKPSFLGGILGDKFKTDFDMMSLQRILKAAGTFGYMSMEKNKSDYLRYLPAALRSAREVLGGYPELHELSLLLNRYAPKS